MTATPARPRGACSDALAAEVYRRTIAGVRKRIGHQHLHAQAADDAVGEAFARWLGNPSDKAARSSGEHAHWLVSTAIGHLLDTIPNKHRIARGVRCLAAWAPNTDIDGDNELATIKYQAKQEAIFRKFSDGAEPAHCEDNILGAIDAINAAVRGMQPVPTTTWRDGLDALFTRGWTRAQVAAAVGVSYQSVRAWAAGEIVPHSDRRAEVITLAASDAAPPPAITTRQASRAPKRPAPRVPDFQMQRHPRPRRANPAVERVLAMVRDMTSRGDRQIDIALSLGVSESCVSAWTLGKSKPGSAQSAKVLAHAQNAAPRSAVDLSQEPVAVA